MTGLVRGLIATVALALPLAAQGGVDMGPHGAPHGPLTPAVVHERWSEAALDALGALPIQAGGRVKPLSTHAGFTLLRLAGRRSVEDAAGERLGPDAFLLETLVRPESAARLPLFLVAESAAIDAIGLDGSLKKRRARWSFDELRPALPRLFELAHDWSRIEAPQRSATQQQTVQLAEAVDQFLDLGGFLDFARVELPVVRDSALAELLGADSGRAHFSELVAAAPAVGQLYRTLSTSDDPLEREELRGIDGVLRLAAELGRSADGLALVPPAGSADEAPEWRTPGDILTAALDGAPASEAELAALRGFEALAAAIDNDSAESALALLTASTRAAAEARGEAGKLDLERSYYGAKPLMWALMAFLVAFVAATATWLRPKARLPYRLCTTLAWTGLALLTLAIAVRCVIRGRPPVSTLYETVLFVTATAVLLALVTEAIDRRRIAASAAAALGAVGLFLASGYEKLDAKDTMPELVAVLDTNFWLATHVTSITIGYAAGMLAALLGSAYVVMRLLRRRDAAPETFRALARMVYGTLCFGLLFSLVGTILGGLWANDSWGRFWGWDPKENGALLICLTMTAILHGRMGGHLKELGICVAAAFGGSVVAFSWWGVNLLGVGLHSYGFTSGIARALWTYYGLQWAICALGVVVWYRAKVEARTRGEERRPKLEAIEPALDKSAA
ncbi:cytochrome c biogenesis protein [Engelhardtia mirabilis]|uniref:Cytochrome c biogenesis protein CcsA n=1 Tax=Engelhardtia mirabilis TaxID=2528011 RepID=A0A518BN93_9BACT|nr:Cytochrome c biogenesis protein CcsA [Planctomycetes bacterium Pla133]QDV02751.1 Cytochrome c biogenesis protein CcsA [Planctomycetes bacterium Pla86]